MSDESTTILIAEQVRMVEEGIDMLTRKLDLFEAARNNNAGLSAAVLQRLLSEQDEDSAIAHGDTEWVLLSSVVVSNYKI